MYQVEAQLSPGDPWAIVFQTSLLDVAKANAAEGYGPRKNPATVLIRNMFTGEVVQWEA